jgi:hypothetical protein
MRRTNLPGHALRSEGKPYVLGPLDGERWVRSEYTGGGVALCECGTVSGWLTSNAARQRWHRDVHKPEVRAALSSKEK